MSMAYESSINSMDGVYVNNSVYCVYGVLMTVCTVHVVIMTVCTVCML